MNILLLAGLGAILLVAMLLVAMLLWRRRKKPDTFGDSFTGNVDASGRAIDAIDSMAAPMDTDAADGTSPHAALERELRALLAAGNKVAALKLVHEHTGLGLKQSRDVLKQLEKGAPLSIPSPAAPSSLSSTTFGHAHADADARVDAEVRRLVSANQKIDAIKLVRMSKGLDLKDAKEYVERL